MKRTSLFLATAMASALTAGAALAQGSTSNTAPTNPPATSSSNASSSNAATSSSASTGSVQFMTQETGNEWRMSKLKGLNVYNNNNEKLGSIDDILVDKQGQIKALVIGVGGFLGIGDHQVAVPFNQVQFVQDTNRNVAANNAATGTNNPPSRPANPAGDTTTSTGLGSPANPTGAPPNTATTTNTGAGTVNTAARRSDDAPDRAILNATRDQLKAAPQFKWNTAG